MPEAHVNAGIIPIPDRTKYMTPDITDVNPLPASGVCCSDIKRMMLSDNHTLIHDVLFHT